MIDFVGRVLRFAAARREAKRGKGRVLAAVAVIGGLAGLGLAALLKNLVPVLLGAGLALAAGWAASRVGSAEWARVLQFARDMWAQLRDILAAKEEELEQLKGDPREFTLEQVLALANEDELGTLERILGKKFESREQLTQALRRKATHEFAYYVRRLRGQGAEFAVEDYGKMLDLVGAILDVERHERSDYEYETLLVENAFSQLTKDLSEDDRKKLEGELNKLADNLAEGGNVGLALTSGGLVAANLGGFATYTMATSIIGGVSSLVGVTLPFAFYTGFASVLSTIIGPVGWTALGAWFAH
ncbi:hypothetical protein D6779_01770, partial [Candidatus Parcubacteria bacterium]